MAYSGQLIRNISNTFYYNEVSPEEHVSVLFLITVNDINELAETLFNICCGYANNAANGEFDYVISAGEYVAEVGAGLIFPACPYFIAVLNEICAEEKDV